MDSKDYILPFGKHKGKTIDDVYTEDPAYLEWVKDTFGDGRVLTEVKKYLHEE